MPCHSPTVPLFLIGIIQAAVFATYSGNCQYALNVTNDGPATLDVPVTVSAFLECADNEAEYLYEFEDDIHRVVRLVAHEEATTSFIFTDYSSLRTVQVTAYLFSHPLFLVAKGKTSFRIEDYIPGTLNFSGIVEGKDGHKFVETGLDINISVHLHYPNQVLKDSEFAYSWTIGEEHFSTEQSFIIHRFTDDGPQWVRVAVVGRIPSYDGKSMFRYKWGYFNSEITVKDPIYNINISGNTYLEHGQLLDLDISCNGSGPVEYCWKVLPPTNNTNLSCSDPVTVTDCSFPILYYFRDSGDYLLAIYVNNLITSLQRDVEVHIYDVSLRPELSTVIIPLVCSVLVVLIIATAVVLHMRRNLSYNIETADFDFMRLDDTSSTVAVETSWQIMRRSLLHLIQLRCLFYSTEGGAPNVNYGTILVGVER